MENNVRIPSKVGKLNYNNSFEKIDKYIIERIIH